MNPLILDLIFKGVKKENCLNFTANHTMASGNWNQSVWQERHLAPALTSASYAWQSNAPP